MNALCAHCNQLEIECIRSLKVRTGTTMGKQLLFNNELQIFHKNVETTELDFHFVYPLSI